MAKTKQSARKSTGLGPLRKTLATYSAAERKIANEVSDDDDSDQEVAPEAVPERQTRARSKIQLPIPKKAGRFSRVIAPGPAESDSDSDEPAKTYETGKRKLGGKAKDEDDGSEEKLKKVKDGKAR